MTSAFVSHEDVYTDDSDDQVEQERQRQYENIVATVPIDAVLDIVLDDMRHNEVSELREYIQQTLEAGEVMDYMPQSTGLRLAQDVARRVAIAISGQVAMRVAALEARA